MAGTYNVLQALIPGLEERAWMFPPLRSRVQVHAGTPSSESRRPMQRSRGKHPG